MDSQTKISPSLYFVNLLNDIYKNCSVYTLHNLLVKIIKEPRLVDYLNTQYFDSHYTQTDQTVGKKRNNRKRNKTLKKLLEKQHLLSSFLHDTVVVFPNIPSYHKLGELSTQEHIQHNDKLSQEDPLIQNFNDFLNHSGNKFDLFYESKPLYTVIDKIVQDVSLQSTPIHQEWKDLNFMGNYSSKFSKSMNHFFKSHLLKQSFRDQKRVKSVASFLSTSSCWNQLKLYVRPSVLYYILSCTSVFCNTDINNQYILAQKYENPIPSIFPSSTYVQVSGCDFHEVYSAAYPKPLAVKKPTIFGPHTAMYKKPLFKPGISSGLPFNHALNVHTDIDKDSHIENVFESIFKRKMECNESAQSTEFIKLLMNAHRKCRYDIILDRTCGTNILEESSKIVKRVYQKHNKDKQLSLNHTKIKDLLFKFSDQEKAEYFEALLNLRNLNTCESLVGKYCCAVFKQLFSKIVGTNLYLLLGKVKKFTSLQNNESISLNYILDSIEYAEFTISSELIEPFLSWVFAELLPSLLRTAFYLTDACGESKASQIYYFRYDVWFTISGPAFDDFAKNSSLDSVSETHLENITKPPFGITQIRLMPKIKYMQSSHQKAKDLLVYGFRPISRMNRAMCDHPILKKLREEFGEDTAENNIPAFVDINNEIRETYEAVNFEYKRKLESAGDGEGKVTENLKKKQKTAHAPSFQEKVATISSQMDFYEKLLKYKQKLASNQDYYFVKVDIQKCYDTIPQEIAIEACKKLLVNISADDMVSGSDIYKTYINRNFNVFYMHGKSASALDRLSLSKTDSQIELLKKVRVRYFRQIENLVNSKTSFQEAESLSNSHVSKLKLFNKPNDFDPNFAAIFVDKDTSTKPGFSGEKGVYILEQHIKNNLVYFQDQFKNHVYHQKAGIPQGSKMSNLLCNLVYEQLEQYLFQILSNQKNNTLPDFFMSRYIDDFLFISTCKSSAQLFLNRMLKGVDKYGATVNAEKTLINFQPSLETDLELEKKLKLCKVLDPHGYMPYIGLGIKMDTIELFRDVNISLSGESFKKLKRQPFGTAPSRHVPCESTVERDDSQKMIEKMVYIVSTRLGRLFVDSQINSWSTILSNLEFVTTDVAKHMAFAIHIRWGFPASSDRCSTNAAVSGNQKTVTKMLIDVIDKLHSIVLGSSDSWVPKKEKTKDVNESAEKDRENEVFDVILKTILDSFHFVKRQRMYNNELLNYGIRYLEML